MGTLKDAAESAVKSGCAKKEKKNKVLLNTLVNQEYKLWILKRQQDMYITTGKKFPLGDILEILIKKHKESGDTFVIEETIKASQKNQLPLTISKETKQWMFKLQFETMNPDTLSKISFGDIIEILIKKYGD